MYKSIFYSCRLCLNKLISNSIDCKTEGLSIKIQDLYNVQILPNDKCSTRICKECLNQTMDHYNFKQKVLTVQKSIEETLLLNANLLKDNEIVTIKDEDDDDDEEENSRQKENVPVPNAEEQVLENTPALSKTVNRSCSQNAKKDLTPTVPLEKSNTIIPCIEDDDDDVVFVGSELVPSPAPSNVTVKEREKWKIMESYECSECPKLFPTKQLCGEHFLKTHNKNAIECLFCSVYVTEPQKHVFESCTEYRKQKELVAKKKLSVQLDRIDNVDNSSPPELEEEESLLVPVEPAKKSKSKQATRNTRSSSTYFETLPWENEINVEVIRGRRKFTRAKSVAPNEPPPLAKENLAEKQPEVPVTKAKKRSRAKSCYAKRPLSEENDDSEISETPEPPKKKSVQIDVEALTKPKRGRPRVKSTNEGAQPTRKKNKKRSQPCVLDINHSRMQTNKIPVLYKASCSLANSVETVEVGEKNMLSPDKVKINAKEPLHLEKNVRSTMQQQFTKHLIDKLLNKNTIAANQTPKHVASFEISCKPSNEYGRTRSQSRTPRHEPTYDYELIETSKSYKHGNKRISQRTSSGSARTSESSSVELNENEAARNDAPIIMKIKKSTGISPVYTSTIEQQPQPPSTTVSQTVAPVSEDVTTDPEPVKIDNRRKSSVADRQIQICQTNPNVLDSILQTMSNSNPEPPSPVLKTLKILTPGQLNANLAPIPAPQQLSPHIQQQNLLPQQHNSQKQQQNSHPQQRNSQIQQQNSHPQQRSLQIQQHNLQIQQNNSNLQQQRVIQPQNQYVLSSQQQSSLPNHLHQPFQSSNVLKRPLTHSMTSINQNPQLGTACTPQRDLPENPQSNHNIHTSSLPSSVASHRHFQIKLCRMSNNQHVGLKIYAVQTKAEVEVSGLSNVEKKLLRESILENKFYSEALKVFVKMDCSYVRKQLEEIFMGKMPQELGRIVGSVKGESATPVTLSVRPNFYNERIDDDIEIIY